MMMNNNYKLQNTACCVKHTMQRCYIAPEIRAFANNLDRYFASCYAPAANNLLRSFSSTSHHSSLKKDNASTKMKKNKFNKFRLIFSLNNFLKHMTLNNICFSLFVIFITILLRYNGVSPLVFLVLSNNTAVFRAWFFVALSISTSFCISFLSAVFRAC
jgi:hypothetical protein